MDEVGQRKLLGFKSETPTAARHDQRNASTLPPTPPSPRCFDTNLLQLVDCIGRNYAPGTGHTVPVDWGSTSILLGSLYSQYDRVGSGRQGSLRVPPLPLPSPKPSRDAPRFREGSRWRSCLLGQTLHVDSWSWLLLVYPLPRGSFWRGFAIVPYCAVVKSSSAGDRGGGGIE